jgi:integrase
MEATPPGTSRKRKSKAHHVATCGRERVSVYRRRTPSGGWAYMVANYAAGKRRFDSYPTEREATEAAAKLARQMSERDVVAASITRDQAIEYAAVVQALKPLNLDLVSAVTVLAQAVKIVGDLPAVVDAAKLYAAHNRTVKRKRVAAVVAELCKVKEARGASKRYRSDLKYRLGRFAKAFQVDTCDVGTEAIQGFMDKLKLAPQSYTNFRRVLGTLFEFAKARGYATVNPVEGVDKVTPRSGDVTIYTPAELAKLLKAAKADFLPAIAIAAFAGLRSAEIVRLEWSDIDLAAGHLVVTAAKSKTASRRVVPIVPALAEWLANYAERKGRVWAKTERKLYTRQQEAAAKSGVEWKHNALRHSFISYRLAETQNAAQVSLEAGNSPQMIHRHYKELVKPADALAWFGVRPKQPENVINLRRKATA